MIKTSKLTFNPPKKYVSDIQKDIYILFNELGVEFQRVDCEPAISMEDCLAIDEALGIKTVKTILLNNQQKTKFYLFVTPGDKRFDCKAFSRALEISRTSFANEENFKKYMHAEIGGASPLAIIYDKDLEINVVLDEDVFNSEFIGLNDCTTTSYLKIFTSDLLHKILPYTNHNYTVIKM